MPGDGLKAVAKAAELMVEMLGSRAAKEALSHKRKTIKLGDVERAGEHGFSSKIWACDLYTSSSLSSLDEVRKHTAGRIVRSMLETAQVLESGFVDACLWCDQ